jgi:hypothetical protein
LRGTERKLLGLGRDAVPDRLDELKALINTQRRYLLKCYADIHDWTPDDTSEFDRLVHDSTLTDTANV